MGFTRRTTLGGLAGAAWLTQPRLVGAQTRLNTPGLERPSDLGLGNPKAPVVLIEYASTTCPHCKDFHESIFPAFERIYVKTGRVRFLFREMPAPPTVAQAAAASFQVARCGNATPEEYLRRIGVLFDVQDAMFSALAAGQGREALQQMATSFGLTEAQFNSCIADEAGYKRIEDTVEHAVKTYKISGTPTLVLNGEVLTGAETVSLEVLSKRLDLALASSH